MPGVGGMPGRGKLELRHCPADQWPSGVSWKPAVLREHLREDKFWKGIGSMSIICHADRPVQRCAATIDQDSEVSSRMFLGLWSDEDEKQQQQQATSEPQEVLLAGYTRDSQVLAGLLRLVKRGLVAYTGEIFAGEDERDEHHLGPESQTINAEASASSRDESAGEHSMMVVVEEEEVARGLMLLLKIEVHISRVLLTSKGCGVERSHDLLLLLYHCCPSMFSPSHPPLSVASLVESCGCMSEEAGRRKVALGLLEGALDYAGPGCPVRGCCIDM
jgi:hypothetical protein